MFNPIDKILALAFQDMEVVHEIVSYSPHDPNYYEGMIKFFQDQAEHNLAKGNIKGEICMQLHCRQVEAVRDFMMATLEILEETKLEIETDADFLANRDLAAQRYRDLRKRFG